MKRLYIFLLFINIFAYNLFATQKDDKTIKQIEDEITENVQKSVSDFPKDIANLVSQYARISRQNLVNQLLTNLFNNNDSFKNVLGKWLEENYFNENERQKKETAANPIF